ncbi:MAG: ribonuclease HII [Candidatus Aenigmarchaeota archaeon]|nr:ribonuclease HII [Candidatus Aenigmarchaeota archaeon]
MILGIDEAGRGAVIGPLVLCGLLINDGDEKTLKEMGVKDSKLLSPHRREELEGKIKPVAKDFMLVAIQAHEIDSLRTIKNLNEIEMDKMAEITNLLKPSKVIIDCPESNTAKFTDNFRRKLKVGCEVVAENYADKNYPVVGGASILAKVLRDKSIRMLEERIKESVGSGYPSDPVTKSFLEKLSRRGDYPDYVRKSWITAIRLQEQKQGRLEDFF